MAEMRTRNVVLSTIGAVAWLLYVLACGASFSPDDSKVLFPSVDPATGATVVAMYDRTVRTTRALLTLATPSRSSDMVPVRAVWTPDGSRVVALWGEDDHVLRTSITDGPSVIYGEEDRMLRTDACIHREFSVHVWNVP